MKYEHSWIDTGQHGRTVYAIGFECSVAVDKTEVHFHSFVGAYEKVEGGFKPQHRRTKVHATEIEAKRDVIGHAISQHQKEIRKLNLELDRLSKQ